MLIHSHLILNMLTAVPNLQNASLAIGVINIGNHRRPQETPTCPYFNFVVLYYPINYVVGIQYLQLACPN